MSTEQFVYQSNNRIKRKELQSGLLVNYSNGFNVIASNGSTTRKFLSCLSGNYSWMDMETPSTLEVVTPNDLHVFEGNAVSTTRSKNDIFLCGSNPESFSRVPFPEEENYYIFRQDSTGSVSITPDPIYSKEGLVYAKDNVLNSIAVPTTNGNYYLNKTSNSIQFSSIPNGILVGSDSGITSISTDLTQGALIVGGVNNSFQTLPTPTSGARIDLKVSGGYIAFEENRMKIYQHTVDTSTYTYATSTDTQIAGTIVTDRPADSNIYGIYVDGYFYFENLTPFESCSATNTYRIDLRYGSASNSMVVGTMLVGNVAENMLHFHINSYMSGRELSTYYTGNQWFLNSDIPTTTRPTLVRLNLTVIRH